jgi:polyphosphate glucokinase
MADAQAEPIPVVGVDIGGSGIKAAPVDRALGTFTAERGACSRRFRPRLRASPTWFRSARAAERARSDRVDAAGRRAGVVETAANIDPGWIGSTRSSSSPRDRRSVAVINDADAAGIAEIRFGAGVGRMESSC